MGGQLGDGDGRYDTAITAGCRCKGEGRRGGGGRRGGDRRALQGGEGALNLTAVGSRLHALASIALASWSKSVSMNSVSSVTMHTKYWARSCRYLSASSSSIERAESMARQPSPSQPAASATCRARVPSRRRESASPLDGYYLILSEWRPGVFALGGGDGGKTGEGEIAVVCRRLPVSTSTWHQHQQQRRLEKTMAKKNGVSKVSSEQ